MSTGHLQAHVLLSEHQPRHPFPLGCKSCLRISEYAAAQAAKHWKSQTVYSNCWLTTAGKSATAQAQNCLVLGGFKTQQTALTLLSLPWACQLKELSVKTVFETVEGAGVPLLEKTGVH